jgi:hypothetical protein
MSVSICVYLVFYLGRLHLVHSDAVERHLRLAVAVRLGDKKRDLSGAIEAAAVDCLNTFGDGL